MKYPCENCLIDTMCEEPCDKIIFFVDSLIGKIGPPGSIPKNWIKNRLRMKRILDCRNFSPSTRLFQKFIFAYCELHKVSYWIAMDP
ncbi:MAG: hypothetical protein ACFFG0_00125 [Candidatus Thorarchaeota archaeon]